MAMIDKVRRMHDRQKKSVREIARATSLSRSTVCKYLRAKQLDEPKYERRPVPTKLTPFHEAIKQALKADARRSSSTGATKAWSSAACTGGCSWRT
jgi:transposase